MVELGEFSPNFHKFSELAAAFYEATVRRFTAIT
jgi:hypothetical protein